MKIVLNAASAKMGGAANYITNLLRQLSVEGDGSEFLVFLPPETAAKLEALTPNIQVVPTAIGHAGLPRRMWWEQVTLRRFLRRHQADVLYSTANFAMFFCPARQLLLVRNSLYFSKIYREMFLPKHSLRYRAAFALRRWLIGRSARAADLVMTPTQTMLDELRRYVNVKNAVVNPYGIATQELREKDVSADRFEAAGKQVVRLLYVSLYSEHKNLNTLLKALAILNASAGTRFKLTTTANPAWAGAAWTVTHKEDVRLAHEVGIADSVDFAGPLSLEETESLYAASDVFVFPSLTESFGFPLVEALRHGLPILAADTLVNREVCGEVATFFDPLNAGDLAGRLLTLASDTALCCRLGRRGREEAISRFSWNAHARQIIESAVCRCPEPVRGSQTAPLVQ